MPMRRKAREVALKALFQIDLVNTPPEQALAYAGAEAPISEEAAAFAREIVLGTLRRLSEVDARIAALSKDWDIRRMPAVDRNILRMAAYEILWRDDVPPEVAINEAVELAKKYGDTKSSAFVNGILGNMHRMRNES